ncbi:hypothetical protein LGL08_20045 [Clostridium estertheticum]|uniref:hypothetical protein n=1 Tax=Clostridium estertheticum TaxID=238834 RepID=UPI001CF4D316|nr:hypothetical protein [Clostridium estertheticum]MCB2308997.1 hypothetical protein [Clostridium estertheticum]MCB2346869.1 hypothetical protein [Clostridium estertheticum]MCB2351819.1 hypothetical protein [Clostridium estertheticum]WAG48423.1 hypothetical protein LL127_22850 [Clostridium estertheticum]
MSKLSITVPLSEMQAIKHGVQARVSKRNEFLTGNGYTVSGRIMAEKDQVQEKALIIKIQNRIDGFMEKNNIKKAIS